MTIREREVEMPPRDHEPVTLVQIAYEPDTKAWATVLREVQRPKPTPPPK